MPIDGVEVMNDKGELEDLKMEHATITKAVMTLSMLLNTVLRSNKEKTKC